MEQMGMNGEKEKPLEEKVEEVLSEQQQMLETYFDITLDRPKVYLISTREEMDKAFRGKTPDWVSANTNSQRGEITIFRPEKFEEVTTHRKEEFWGTLRHEIVHIAFAKAAHGSIRPRWLNEGFAQVKSGQKNVLSGDDLDEVLSHTDHSTNDTYHIGYFWTKHLIDTYGDNKLVQLIKSLKPGFDEQEFQEIFENIYGFKFDVEYIKSVLNEDNRDE